MIAASEFKPDQSEMMISDEIRITSHQGRVVYNSNCLPYVIEKKARGMGRTLMFCTECSYSTVKGAHLRRHIMAVHKRSRPYHCPECSYNTSEKGNLKKHISSVHVKDKPYTCPHCQYCSSWKKDLNRHIMNVHEKNCGGPKDISKKSFHCPKCDFATEFQGGLKNHYRMSHSANKLYKCLKCSHCEYSSCMKTKLKQHILDHHLEIEVCLDNCD